MRSAAAAAGFAFALTLSAGSAPAAESPQDAFDRCLKAYNRHDAEAASAAFQADAEIWKPGAEKPEVAGREAIRQFFADQFREHPKIQSKIVQRMALGSWAAVREKTTPEPGEASRDALLVFEAPEGAIRRLWTMKADDPDDTLGNEGPVGLLIERYNERDLPRLMATLDERATIARLSTGERIAAGEDGLRDYFEKAFDGPPARIDVQKRMAIGPWVVYLERTLPPPAGGAAETLVLYEVRDNDVRRIWLAP